MKTFTTELERELYEDLKGLVTKLLEDRTCKDLEELNEHQWEKEVEVLMIKKKYNIE